MAAPKIIPYDVELRSVNPVRSFDRPKAYTNDLNSVRFQFKVLDMTSEELATATAVTLVYMRDGSFFANPSTDVSRVGNVFSYLLKENEGNHAGVAQIQLVVTVDGMTLASQLFDFEIVNGLETKVAQEVMIYDWTILTRDARAYIDQFVADEVLRDAQFDNAQFDRNITFVETQNQRAADFTADQDSRTATFNASEVSRTQTFTASEAAREQEFDLAEAGRAAGYTADHNRAETDHTIAVDDSEKAAMDHTTAVNDHTLAGTDHTRAEADHTRADADSATVAGFNTRLATEETATAANKISAVKGKTFADVDARFEDVEADTTAMGTNLVTNGNFDTTTGWGTPGGAVSVAANTLSLTSNGMYSYNALFHHTDKPLVLGDVIYNRAILSVKDAICLTLSLRLHGTLSGQLSLVTISTPLINTEYAVSGTTVVDSTLTGNAIFRVQSFYSDSTTANGKILTIRKAMMLNLTAIFGKGNEPTAEQMDAIMAKYTNLWFDGTKNLFRASATLAKQIAIDARTEFEARNLVENGDFSSSDISAFLVNSGTVAVSSGVATVTCNGTQNNAQLYNSKYPRTVGNKIYTRAKFRALNSETTAFRMYSAGSALTEVLSPTLNNWYERSNIGTVGTVNTGNHIRVEAYYTDAATANGKTFEIDNMIAIDLTAAFGSGKEPTLAEMDRLIARFPNSWFDGVKPVQTIESLYQEKANKVQEAWITPTLINGWANSPSYPTVGYFKDTLGTVHLRGVLINGTASTVPFVLPAGYRPIATMKFGCSTNGISFASHSILASGEQYPSSANIDLSSVHFRAEA